MKKIKLRYILPFVIVISIVIVWYATKLFFALVTLFVFLGELFFDLIIFLYKVFGG